MRYFKNVATNEVLGYSQEQIDQGYQDSTLVELTSVELEAHRAVSLNSTISPVTPRQMRQALTKMGLRDAVEAIVATAPQDLKDWWEYATSFEIDHPAVVAMANALTIRQSTLEELFALAHSL